VPKRRGSLIARLLWIFPAVLLFLTINQIKVASDIRETLALGEPAKAEVLEIYMTNRVDVTYGYVRMRIPTDRGDVVRQLSMSISLLHAIDGKDSLDVRLLPGEDMEVVITEVARPQWRMAAINAGISFIGLILLTFGVWSWNRYLMRIGDPAEGAPSSL
jgi:hypothetical protein